MLNQLELFCEKTAAQVVETGGLAVARDAAVDRALGANAPCAVSVSGGKDSFAAAIATHAHLEAIGHTGPRLLIHADLGTVEWADSLPACERLAAHLGWELVVVRRAAGDMMERWESRWASSLRRYAALETLTLVLPWSTPAMRFCTSELKTNVILPALRRRYRGEVVVNVTGVRREESSARAKAPVAAELPKFRGSHTPILSWNPVVTWGEASVFDAIERSGVTGHMAYGLGMSRVSCCFCIMSNGRDMEIAVSAPDNHAIYRRMVALEAASSFGFQGTRWLADLAPQLLDDALTQAVARGKAIAAERQRLEAMIPADLRFRKGVAERLPSREEAALVASTRQTLCAHFGIEGAVALDAEGVMALYRERCLPAAA
ncbi:3'-phosphoadenosine 5'-phosphosulfate sulfotransferase (PAPS reductase)/FAD synthetase [Natronocella acetinitrilica]|uniref:3'-phosphoadenosine 5'-phosphosulfate sulfotransferase (PAPS reductase)/FAD synthetase n=1 Tax=Natronocella acetinitrilica TaxID=414046 RepID=A0AAE3G379_9GAMM|nr:phosphoadenosine phosphosulfate reductase family protein [Natronocella acetinitrilica]MCP1674348.1 3'-phosphoadenosine 5'-phosphosulfate sulfotransferase (PAPS reductase)/FAD synthetase [Natronocella acetinitrilica]